MVCGGLTFQLLEEVSVSLMCLAMLFLGNASGLRDQDDAAAFCFFNVTSGLDDASDALPSLACCMCSGNRPHVRVEGEVRKGVAKI